MTSPDLGALVAGVIVTLSLFGLIAFVVHRTSTSAGRTARVLMAVATVIATLPAILITFYGG